MFPLLGTLAVKIKAGKVSLLAISHALHLEQDWVHCSAFLLPHLRTYYFTQDKTIQSPIDGSIADYT